MPLVGLLRLECLNRGSLQAVVMSVTALSVHLLELSLAAELACLRYLDLELAVVVQLQYGPRGSSCALALILGLSTALSRLLIGLFLAYFKILLPVPLYRMRRLAHLGTSRTFLERPLDVETGWIGPGYVGDRLRGRG